MILRILPGSVSRTGSLCGRSSSLVVGSRPFHSDNSNQHASSGEGPFGPRPYLWFTKQVFICGAIALAISSTEMSDWVVEESHSKLSRLISRIGKIKDDNGLKMPEAFAFSVPDHGMHPPHYPWEHKKFYRTYDHAAIRRGFQIYREVCSACHGLKQLCLRNLIGVSHTEQEVRDIASEYEVSDGPDDTGEMFERPGRPADSFPSPYPNDETARATNNGALPPDLSCIVRARHGEEDYVFSLLTGYCDPPPGVVIREGLYYNPFFPGGSIAMAPPLTDGTIDYDDESPNNLSQLAKDVTMFLTWASYPEHDERKKYGLKAVIIISTLLAATIWWKRFKWSYLKSRRIIYKPPKETAI